MFIPDTVELQDYTLVKKIGQGSFGELYIIEPKEKVKGEDKKYAAKILLKEYSESKNCLTRLRVEVNVLSKLSHPAILTYIGFNKFGFNADKRSVIVTEYMSNGSLDRILKLQRQSKIIRCWTNTKKLINIYGIASAMAYLHYKNIIHRDLKPANILEDEYLFPKICDFGLAKILHQNIDSMTAQSNLHFVGTPAYAPPEEWKNQQFDKPGDVYAFSLIVYAIMTNEEPFLNSTNYEILDNVAYHNYRPSLSLSIPEAYRNLITRCWAANPEERPTFEEIVNDLQTNKGFILDDINEEEFKNYIKYIERPEKMKKYFKRPEIGELNANSTVDIAFRDLFYEDINNKAFKELPRETQNMISEIISNDNADLSKISLNQEQIDMLFQNGSLKSPIFINILKYFDEIFTTINYPSKNYNSIYEILAEIKVKYIERMDLTVIISNINKIDNQFINNEIINNVIICEPVSEIDKEAFRGCNSLRKITIPEPVPKLGKSIFRGCSSLTEISIPNSVTTIEKHTFRGCHKIKSITIPDSVTSIEKSVFRGCFQIQTLKLSNNLESLQRSTFRGCSRLKELIIPPSVTIIEANSLEKCSSLVSITFPPSLLVIQKKAFRGCSKLNTITFDPFNGIEIAPNAFQECFELKNLIISTSKESISHFDLIPFPNVRKISISQKVIQIESFAFKNCSSIVEFVIPDTLIVIKNSSFEGCSSLQNLSIPSSVREIQSLAFRGCSALKELEIDPYNTQIHIDAFQDCNSLSLLKPVNSTEVLVPFDLRPFPLAMKILIPDNVTSIDKYGFQALSARDPIFIESSSQQPGVLINEVPYVTNGGSTYNSDMKF